MNLLHARMLTSKVPTEDDPFISRHICVPDTPESNPDRLLTIPAATDRFSLCYTEFIG